MITDKDTNFVYISDLLEAQCPSVYGQLKHWFDKLGIDYALLPNTKDLWVVDFMPLQINRYDYLQFKYDPDYLKPKKYQHFRTDSNEACVEVKIASKQTDIVLDGGNIVKCKSKAIATTKIFKENSYCLEDDLIAEIKTKLKIEQLIIIPQEPKDFVGHADGMVRFINEDTVLVNEYPQNKIYGDFSRNLRSSLRNAGLNCVEFPYTSWQNEDASDATGCYINFLEIGNYIFYPVFDNLNDQRALTQLKYAFQEREFICIDCRELAKFGGVLNCATWNVLKTKQILPKVNSEKVILEIGYDKEKISLKSVFLTDVFLFKLEWIDDGKINSKLFVTQEDAWGRLKELFPKWHHLSLVKIGVDIIPLLKDDYFTAIINNDEVMEHWFIQLTSYSIGF